MAACFCLASRLIPATATTTQKGAWWSWLILRILVIAKIHYQYSNTKMLERVQKIWWMRAYKLPMAIRYQQLTILASRSCLAACMLACWTLFVVWQQVACCMLLVTTWPCLRGSHGDFTRGGSHQLFKHAAAGKKQKIYTSAWKEYWRSVLWKQEVLIWHYFTVSSQYYRFLLLRSASLNTNDFNCSSTTLIGHF